MNTTERVRCPRCRQVFQIRQLKIQQGAFIGKMPLEKDGEDSYQVDYLCPHCEKIVLCDTDGKGKIVAMHSDEQIEAFQS